VQRCLLNLPAPTLILERPELIDHRFFFRRKDGTGGYSCGVVRKAVTDALTQSQQYFVNGEFLKAMSTFYNNPSTLGFFMEYAVLYYLNNKGLSSVPILNHRMDVRTFKTDIPDIQNDPIGTPVVYHPIDWNYKTLDGIIVLIEEGLSGRKKKLTLCPYQVTLHRANHEDSHEVFFDNYDRWIAGLEEYDGTPMFIWFTADDSSHVPHRAVPGSSRGATPKRPAHTEYVVNFGDLDKDLWDKYKEAQNKADKEKRDKKAEKASREKAEQEEQEEMRAAQEAMKAEQAKKGKKQDAPKKAEQEAKKAQQQATKPTKKGRGGRRKKA